MFDRRQPATIAPASPPLLVVTVDTEAEFDWTAPYSRDRRGVGSLARQHLAQSVMARYGVVPTYLVDSAVVADDAAVETLRGFLSDGACEVGAHLNPWLARPFDEVLSPANSFAGNLGAGLERAKLAGLTEQIGARFGRAPLVYRAGRFGIGRHTPAILRELGYQIDMSVASYSDFSEEGGPDFSALGPRPFWIGEAGGLLEIPVTWAHTGALAARGKALHRIVSGPMGTAARLPGLLARLGVVEIVRLTPEGESFAALCRLTDTLLRGGTRVFSLSYHSPSLAPGNTPYVRSEADLERFLCTLENYFDYFFRDANGVAVTPVELRRRLLADAGADRAAAAHSAALRR